MAAFEAWLVFLILVVNVVGELQRKRTLAASRLSCFYKNALHKSTFDIDMSTAYSNRHKR